LWTVFAFSRSIVGIAKVSGLKFDDATILLAEKRVKRFPKGN
jgi:hypothetical protein